MSPLWPFLVVVGLFALDFWATTHFRSIAARYGYQGRWHSQRSTSLVRRRWIILVAWAVAFTAGIFATGVLKIASFVLAGFLTLAYGAVLFIWSLRTYQAAQVAKDRMGD
jgi:hypothetical protein